MVFIVPIYIYINIQERQMLAAKGNPIWALEVIYNENLDYHDQLSLVTMVKVTMDNEMHTVQFGVFYQSVVKVHGAEVEVMPGNWGWCVDVF